MLDRDGCAFEMAKGAFGNLVGGGDFCAKKRGETRCAAPRSPGFFDRNRTVGSGGERGLIKREQGRREPREWRHFLRLWSQLPPGRGTAAGV